MAPRRHAGGVAAVTMRALTAKSVRRVEALANMLTVEAWVSKSKVEGKQ